MSVALFSPIRRDDETLRRVIPNWFALQGVDEMWCYDDNPEGTANDLLKKFRVLPKLPLETSGYEVTEETHVWTQTEVRRVAQIKDAAIEEFLKTPHSHLFLVDSDLLLHPNLVPSLLLNEKPIVSAVFWTRWRPGEPYLPNCWDYQPYGFLGEDSLLRLRRAGTYQVGGLGACTLIHRSVLEDGVRFEHVPSLPAHWGEDRSFCVRAQARKWPLFADSHYPPFHLYRPSLLPESEEWERAGMTGRYFENLLGEEWERLLHKLLN